MEATARPAHRTGRFHAAWEQQASLRLRDGEPEQMTDAYLALTLDGTAPGTA